MICPPRFLKHFAALENSGSLDRAEAAVHWVNYVSVILHLSVLILTVL